MKRRKFLGLIRVPLIIAASPAEALDLLDDKRDREQIIAKPTKRKKWIFVMTDHGEFVYDFMPTLGLKLNKQTKSGCPFSVLQRDFNYGAFRGIAFEAIEPFCMDYWMCGTEGIKPSIVSTDMSRYFDKRDRHAFLMRKTDYPELFA